jgi:hypothetical protein
MLDKFREIWNEIEQKIFDWLERPEEERNHERRERKRWRTAWGGCASSGCSPLEAAERRKPTLPSRQSAPQSRTTVYSRAAHERGASAQPLDQPHLYLRLHPHYGGESYLRGVVRLTITRGGACCLRLGFL